MRSTQSSMTIARQPNRKLGTACVPQTGTYFSAHQVPKVNPPEAWRTTPRNQPPQSSSRRVRGVAISFLLPVKTNGDEDTAVFANHGVVALAILTFGAHLCWTALSDGKPDLDTTFHDALKVGTLWHSSSCESPSRITAVTHQQALTLSSGPCRHLFCGHQYSEAPHLPRRKALMYQPWRRRPQRGPGY